MEKFVKPEIEVIIFEAEDIITKSCSSDSSCGDATMSGSGMPAGDTNIACTCGFYDPFAGMFA